MIPEPENETGLEERPDSIQLKERWKNGYERHENDVHE